MTAALPPLLPTARADRIAGVLPLVLLFCLMLPVTAMVPVLPALTSGRFDGLGQFESHLFMSINMAGALLGAPLAGLLSDRLGRRKALIVAALAANGILLLGIAYAETYAVVLGLRFVEGFAHMSALSLLMTLGAERAAQGKLGARMGAVGACISLGVAAGAPLGGAIGGIDPLWVPLLGGLSSIVLALVAALGLREPAGARPRLPAAEIVHALRSRRELLIPMAFSFVDRLTVGFIVSTLVLYLGTVLHFDPPAIGAAMAAFLIPFSLLTWPAGHLCRRFDPFRMMVAGSVFYGVFLGALGYVPAAWVVVAMGGGGVIAALMYAPSLVLLAQYAGPECRASAVAAFNMAGSLGFACGPLLSSALLAFYQSFADAPYAAVFVSIGALEVTLALGAYLLLGRTRQLAR